MMDIVRECSDIKFKGQILKLESKSSEWLIFFIVLLFISAYKAWVISLICPHPLPYHPLHPVPLPPTPSIPRRNYLALIANLLKREYKQ
jgi:hypothetical protein